MLLFIEERWIMQLFIWCHTQQKIALLFWAELRRAKLRKALTFASRELWYALVRVFTKFPWGRVLAYHIFTTFLVWTRRFVFPISNGLQKCYLNVFNNTHAVSNLNLSFILVGLGQKRVKFTSSKSLNCNLHFWNGICNRAISILKWVKFLIIIMGFTNASGGQ